MGRWPDPGPSDVEEAGASIPKGPRVTTARTRPGCRVGGSDRLPALFRVPCGVWGVTCAGRHPCVRRIPSLVCSHGGVSDVLTGFRRALIDCLRRDTGFADRSAALVEEYDLGDVAATGQPPSSVAAGLDARSAELLGRVRRFDAGPLGLTLSGPAYRDNPIIYANETLRDLTGYPLEELRGENPRLFQGPETDPDALDTLREAVEVWAEATVELWNYRRDGSRFRNRVSVVPIPDDSGMIANWIGVQAAIDE